MPLISEKTMSSGEVSGASVCASVCPPSAEGHYPNEIPRTVRTSKSCSLTECWGQINWKMAQATVQSGHVHTSALVL